MKHTCQKRMLAILMVMVMIITTVLSNVPMVATTATAEAATSDEFVTTNGTKFWYQGGEYYFGGANCYYISFKSKNDIKDLMEGAKDMGVSVIRTWGHINAGTGTGDGTFQNSVDGNGHKDGIYYQYFDESKGKPVLNEGEDGLQRLDYVIAQAQENDVKLIITFINQWDAFGGMAQYARWAGYSNAGESSKELHDKFYTDETCKTWFKEYVTALLNRENSITGVKYKDDPTIFAWELGNEPRAQSDPQCEKDILYEWVKEMSAYVKKEDPNHMVSIGDEGLFNYAKGDEDLPENANLNTFIWNGGEGTDFTKMLALDTVDFATPHLYVYDWQLHSSRDSSGNTVDTMELVDTWIKHHAEVAHELNKPIIMEEFGWSATKEGQATNGSIPGMEEFYKQVFSMIEKYDYAGSTVWMLADFVELNDGYNNAPYRNYDGYNIYSCSLAEVQEALAGKESQYAEVLSAVEAREPARNLLIKHCANMAAKNDNNSVNPATATADLAKPAAISVDISYQTGAELSKLTMNGKTLTAGTDYTISGTKITFPADFVGSLEEGDNYIAFECSKGTTPELKITVSNSAITAAEAATTTYAFDKNPKSAKNVTISVTINDGGDLKGVKLRGNGSERTALTEGTDYTYSASGSTGTVTLAKSYLSGLSGETAVFELDYTQGTDPVITVQLKDTTGADVIDNFEDYSDDSAVGSAWSRNTNGGDVSTTLASDFTATRAMKYAYATSSYAGVTKGLGNRDLSTFEGIQMTYKPDGSGNKLTIQIHDTADNYWEYYLTLDGTDTTTIKMPFSEFKVKECYNLFFFI